MCIIYLFWVCEGSNSVTQIIPYLKMQARVYEGFKQVIPWKRKQENLERTNSSIV